MADWPQVLDQNTVNISIYSPECLGMVLATLDTLPGSNSWVANLALYIPFIVLSPFNAQKMWIMNGATIAGNIDVGLYDSGQHRLVNMGSTAQSGLSSIQIFDITDTLLLPGEYYMAVAGSSTGNILGPSANVLGRGLGILEQTTAFPLPSPATFAAYTRAFIPIMGVVGRSVL